MSANKRRYIGDGVYAEFEGYYIKLTTMRELKEEVIYIEDIVLDQLIRFANEKWGTNYVNDKTSE